MWQINKSTGCSLVSQIVIISIAILVCLQESQAASLQRRHRRSIPQSDRVTIHFCRHTTCPSSGVETHIVVSTDNFCRPLHSLLDSVSYVQILNGNGRCEVTLFDDDLCRGLSATFNRRENNLLGLSINDKASSYRMTCS